MRKVTKHSKTEHLNQIKQIRYLNLGTIIEELYLVLRASNKI